MSCGELGARAEPRGPAAPGDSGIDALSKRELEIAGLVTDRMTNREIAAALFLSDKTIESHIRNIFHKLGVTSRVEVARAVERERRMREAARRDALAPPVDPDAARLRSSATGRSWVVGSSRRQRRDGVRRRSRPSSACMRSCSSALTVAGPAWVWVLPVALMGQCLLLAVYAELASEFPIAGGAYQWSRRLMGGAYGWLSGWVAICAYCAANTTIAYLGAPWALTLAGHRATPNAIVVTGMVLVGVCAVVGASSVDVLGRVIKAGIAAEIVASVGSGSRCCSSSGSRTCRILGETLGAEALSGGSVGAGMLAALAVAGWVFIGFDCCIGASEETRRAARHVPRAIWVALLSVGVLVILNAFAVTLAHPDLAGGRGRGRPRPGATSVAASFGSWSAKPFAAVVLVGVPRLRDGRADGDRADDVLGRARRRAPGVAVPAPRRPAARAHRRDRDDRRRRLPRPPARPATPPPSAA